MQPRAAGDAVPVESSVRGPMSPSGQMRRRLSDRGSRRPARLLAPPPRRHCRESKSHSCSARELLHRLHFARHCGTAVTSQHALKPCLPRPARVRHSASGTPPPSADVARLLRPRSHPRPDPPPKQPSQAPPREAPAGPLDACVRRRPLLSYCHQRGSHAANADISRARGKRVALA